MYKKVITSIIAIAIFLVAIYGYKFYQNQARTQESGVITFKFYLEDETVVIDEKLEFNKDDTLMILLKKHYKITHPSNEERLILGVEGYITDFKTTYISIYINHKYATQGAADIHMHNDDLIEFKVKRVLGL